MEAAQPELALSTHMGQKKKTADQKNKFSTLEREREKEMKRSKKKEN